MGHWGSGPFDNDMAEDWVDMLCQDKNLARIKRTLGFTGDSDKSCEAIAAAEVVAALRGHPLRGLSEELREWLTFQERSTDENLAERAISTVELILADSELKGLWEDDSKWRAKCENLLERLAMPPKDACTPKKRGSFDPKKEVPKNMTQAAQLFKSLEVYPSYEKRRVVDLYALGNDQLTDRHLQYLSLMPQIESISFQDCSRLTPDGLMLIADLPALVRLQLKGIQIREDMLRKLAVRAQLNSLLLSATGMTDEWLSHLTRFSRLLLLELNGNPITDKGCETIAHINSLDTLYLNSTKVTADGVRHLAVLPELEILGLFRTPVDDTVVPILRDMRQLKTVLLRQSNITREGVKELRRERPDLQVNL